MSEKLNKLRISVEKFEGKTSSHQKLLLDHVEKSDEERMNLKDDIQNERRLITKKKDKINEANLNMQKLSTPFSHMRSPVKPKEEITNPFITDLSHQDNKQLLMKSAPQLKEWPTFTGESEYEHMSFIKKIDMLQEDYSIPDELITETLYSLFEKYAKRWYYGIRKINEEYINSLEDIVTRTKISRTWKKVDIKSPNKAFIKKDEQREPFKTNTTNINEQRKYYKCGVIGQLANNFLKKANISEIVETEDHNDKEEDSDSEKDTEERQSYPASPRAREALEVHIEESMDLGVLSKVGHNEQVEVTTPVIITWHNEKSNMVGYFRALNTYMIPDCEPV
ncbi:hypothetical protein O181_113804, partial [Austropuccinia psidii MF-1]|nr:hypothetical protein [Austropuccinia psidii MF-1]